MSRQLFTSPHEPRNNFFPMVSTNEKDPVNISFMCLQMKQKFINERKLKSQKDTVRSLNKKFLNNKKENNHIQVRRDFQYRDINHRDKIGELYPNYDVNNGGFLEKYQLLQEPKCVPSSKQRLLPSQYQTIDATSSFSPGETKSKLFDDTFKETREESISKFGEAERRIRLEGAKLRLYNGQDPNSLQQNSFMSEMFPNFKDASRDFNELQIMKNVDVCLSRKLKKKSADSKPMDMDSSKILMNVLLNRKRNQQTDRTSSISSKVTHEFIKSIDYTDPSIQFNPNSYRGRNSIGQYSKAFKSTYSGSDEPAHAAIIHPVSNSRNIRVFDYTEEGAPGVNTTRDNASRTKIMKVNTSKSNVYNEYKNYQQAHRNSPTKRIGSITNESKQSKQSKVRSNNQSGPFDLPLEVPIQHKAMYQQLSSNKHAFYFDPKAKLTPKKEGTVESHGQDYEGTEELGGIRSTIPRRHGQTIRADQDSQGTMEQQKVIQANQSKTMTNQSLFSFKKEESLDQQMQCSSANQKKRFDETINSLGSEPKLAGRQQTVVDTDSQVDKNADIMNNESKRQILSQKGKVASTLYDMTSRRDQQSPQSMQKDSELMVRQLEHERKIIQMKRIQENLEKYCTNEQLFNDIAPTTKGYRAIPMSSQSPRPKGFIQTMEHYNKMKSFQKILLLNGQDDKNKISGGGLQTNSFKFNQETNQFTPEQDTQPRTTKAIDKRVPITLSKMKKGQTLPHQTLSKKQISKMPTHQPKLSIGGAGVFTVQSQKAIQQNMPSSASRTRENNQLAPTIPELDKTLSNTKKLQDLITPNESSNQRQRQNMMARSVFNKKLQIAKDKKEKSDRLNKTRRHQSTEGIESKTLPT